MLFLTEKQSAALHRLVDVPPDRIVLRPVYPAPRNRPPAAAGVSVSPEPVGSGGGGGGGGGGVGDSRLRCVGLGGSTVTLGTTTNAGVTSVLASLAIPFSFVIRHIQLQTDQNVASNASTRVKVSNNNAVSGGVDTVGQDVELYGGTGQLFSNFGKILDCFPNFLVPTPNSFIKVVYFNQAAGPVQWQFVIDIDHLG